ncbi:flavin-containing monooxygenase [Actinophytocola sp.]|uniref:flavin-containing monooxygenase n=1 Tax=Actinophytocola sp. TaxID=1872138 RepID=UPI003D6B46F8
MSAGDSANDTGIDADYLAARYREERDRRLRASRDDIVELTGDLARYLDDPYSQATPREPVHDTVDVVVVGAGFGGLMAAARARENGAERVRLVDKAGDVGGVWYWNRYPGAMCDVESYIYLPLLEEMGYVPKHKYSSATEIFEYTRTLAERYGLYEHALFHTAVAGMRWDSDAACWLVETDRKDTFRARFAVLANGALSALKIPDIPDIDVFGGRSFHTSRWDYDYTRGGPHEELDGLADKVVGIVGTGATAIQCVPPVGRAARHLYVFQRTPSTIAVRANRETDPEWAATLRPGWQPERMRNFTSIVTGGGADVDHVADGWTVLYRDLVGDPNFSGLPPGAAAERILEADHRWMERIRSRIADTVEDSGTAEALKPYYRYLCKRPCFHDEYLATFNRTNVTLVDTQGAGIERFYESGVVVDDVKYELDCVIFATGFEIDTPYTRRIGFDVAGRDGVTLSERWSAGVRTLHGLFTHGFPNMFVVPGVNSQSAVTVNFSHSLQENGRHIGYVIGECLRRRVRTFEVRPEAEAEWVRTVVATAKDNRKFLAECTPGRNNNEGRIEDRPAQNVNYGPGALEFFDLLAAWRAAGDLDGLELTGGA